jgi:hypothetical protein
MSHVSYSERHTIHDTLPHTDSHIQYRMAYVVCHMSYVVCHVSYVMPSHTPTKAYTTSCIVLLYVSHTQTKTYTTSSFLKDVVLYDVFFSQRRRLVWRCLVWRLLFSKTSSCMTLSCMTSSFLKDVFLSWRHKTRRPTKTYTTSFGRLL